VQAPRLETATRSGERVVLREHREDDVDALVAMLADDEVVRWTSGPPVPYTREWVAGRAGAWEQQTSTEWAWVLDLEGRAVGQLSLRPRGDGALELGFVLGRPWWGRGLTSAALREAARWAFRPVEQGGAGGKVLHWRARAGNWPSRRVAWACGFRVEGLVRGLLEHRGEPVDGWVGSLRRGDPLRPVVPWLEVPEVEVGDLLLRANVPQDAERIVQACSHPSTRQWLSELPDPYTLDDAHGYVASRGEQHAAADGVYWALAPVDRPDHLLGQISLMGLERGLSASGEIGYWVHPDARRRGVATRAVRAVSRHGLLTLDEGGLGLRRVLLRAAEGNLASVGVAQAAGFTEVGRDRDATRTGQGRVVDHLRFDLLAEELAAALAHPSLLR